MARECGASGWVLPQSSERSPVPNYRVHPERKAKEGAGAIGAHGTAIQLHLLDSPLLSSSFAAVGWRTALSSFKRENVDQASPLNTHTSASRKSDFELDSQLNDYHTAGVVNPLLPHKGRLQRPHVLPLWNELRSKK